MEVPLLPCLFRLTVQMIPDVYLIFCNYSALRQQYSGWEAGASPGIGSQAEYGSQVENTALINDCKCWKHYMELVPRFLAGNVLL